MFRFLFLALYLTSPLLAAGQQSKSSLPPKSPKTSESPDLPPTPLLQEKAGPKLGVVSMFKNSGPYLEEWIEYHLMVGVDHFWLYNDGSDDNFAKVLEPYIKSGIVEVFPSLLTKRDWWGYRQRKSFRDGIDRAKKAKAEWVALIDQDEFLLPMQEKTVPECLDKHFKDASAIYINWRHFGTGGLRLKQKDSQLFNLIASSPRDHIRNRVGKSIVRPDKVTDFNLFNIHTFHLASGVYKNGDGGVLEPLAARKTRTIHDKYLRINHYIFRDENYYHKIRAPRDLAQGRSCQTNRWYYEFCLDRDTKIIDFIKNNHKSKYKSFWQQRDKK